MSSADQPKVYRVGQLNEMIARSIERWGEVWVEGEVSKSNQTGPGHVFFTLADSKSAARIGCVMFQGDARHTKAKIRSGEKIRVRAKCEFYPRDGKFQLIVRLALPVGQGDRKEQIERLKRKLAKEGLFSTERKRPIPRAPRVVGVVTSRQSDALHDVIRVASSRAPVRLVLSRCLVQGADAPESIVIALRRIARLPGLDVAILTRGGGAAEDLMAFDDERVARAIAACPVPVVVGVGHEQDMTIAGLVADLRAATPSNAAELVVPDRAALEAELDGRRRRLGSAMRHRLERELRELGRLGKRLGDPRGDVARAKREIIEATRRLEREVHRTLTVSRTRRADLARRLAELSPKARLGRQLSELDALAHRLDRSMPVALTTRRDALARSRERTTDAWRPIERRARARLGELAARLDALSPLAVLGRGYAIALHEGKALTDASVAKVGDPLRIRLAEGALEAEVRAILPEQE